MIDRSPSQIPQPQEGNLATYRVGSSPNDDTMQEIIPGLFLGPYSTAQLHQLANLREKGIRYIICVRDRAEVQISGPQISDSSFTCLTLDLADEETENIMKHFPKVNLFIDNALSRNGKVLVLGSSGNSRSATLVLAYVMQKMRLTYSQALDIVKSKRASIDPNPGFKAQLIEYEPIYRARLAVRLGGTSSGDIQLRPKRKFSDVGIVC